MLLQEIDMKCIKGSIGHLPEILEDFIENQAYLYKEVYLKNSTQTIYV